jgi:hypothetical protein
MDRGLAKIQRLIQKFFGTAGPADGASGAPVRVRVPDRSYMSAAKRATKQAAKTKNTPFTVVSSHQNKMGLMGIRPLVAEKLHQPVGVVVAAGADAYAGEEAENGKRAYGGEDDRRKKKKRKKTKPELAAANTTNPPLGLGEGA